MKAILMSIKPKYCELIANGKKTVEVRKTKPKIDVPFKCYIYCTKAKDYFSIGGGVYVANDELYKLPTGEIKFGDGFELMGDWRGQYDETNFLNGKVIGEFVCDKFYDIIQYGIGAKVFTDNLEIVVEPSEFIEMSCLSEEQIFEYIGNKDGYGWHISNLVIYDKPKELGEFSAYEKPNCFAYLKGICLKPTRKEFPSCSDMICDYRKLKRPFQSWGYIEGLGV